MNLKSSIIFSQFPKDYFTRFLSLSFKKQIIKLCISCFFLGLIIFAFTFFLYLSRENRAILEADAHRINVIHKIMLAVEERFLFLSNAALDKQKISRVLVNIPSFPLQLLTDIFIINETEKYTKHGRASLLDLEKQYQKEGIFIDSFDNFCFVRKNLNDFYVIRISMNSLLMALGLTETHSLALAQDAPHKKSIKLGKAGWLIIEEEQKPILRTFLEEYVWLIITLPISSILITSSYFFLYSYIYFIVHGKYREQIKDLEEYLNELKNRQNTLNAENQKMMKISSALRRKQKIQGELYQKLLNYRQELSKKITDISRLVSRSFATHDKILDDQEVTKLLNEVSKTAKILSDNLFDMSTNEQLSLKQCVKEIDNYLGWNLLKTGVSFFYNIEEDCILESNPLGLKILLLNILLQHIEHAYEGAEVILNVSRTANKINTIISCKNALETRTMLGSDDLSNPLVLSLDTLEKLAVQLGFSYLTPTPHTTQLTYQLSNSQCDLRGANVVSIFR